MKLGDADCLDHLTRGDHGILSTFHPHRLIDSVPACYAVAGGRLFVPVDLVKPKSSTSLRRVVNLALEPRATLLCERWDRNDWSRLLWVRVNLVWLPDEVEDAPDPDGPAALLRAKYPQYRSEAFAGILAFRIDGMTGWSAGG